MNQPPPHRDDVVSWPQLSSAAAVSPTAAPGASSSAGTSSVFGDAKDKVANAESVDDEREFSPDDAAGFPSFIREEDDDDEPGGRKGGGRDASDREPRHSDTSVPRGVPTSLRVGSIILYRPWSHLWWILRHCDFPDNPLDLPAILVQCLWCILFMSASAKAFVFLGGGLLIHTRRGRVCLDTRQSVSIPRGYFETALYSEIKLDAVGPLVLREAFSNTIGRRMCWWRWTLWPLFRFCASRKRRVFVEGAPPRVLWNDYDWIVSTLSSEESIGIADASFYLRGRRPCDVPTSLPALYDKPATVACTYEDNRDDGKRRSCCCCFCPTLCFFFAPVVLYLCALCVSMLYYSQSPVDSPPSP